MMNRDDPGVMTSPRPIPSWSRIDLSIPSPAVFGVCCLSVSCAVAVATPTRRPIPVAVSAVRERFRIGRMQFPPLLYRVAVAGNVSRYDGGDAPHPDDRGGRPGALIAGPRIPMFGLARRRRRTPRPSGRAWGV